MMNIISRKLKLKIVSLEDYDFLYELLSKRPKNTNISHRKLPSKKQHIKFINSKPYSKWYVVIYDNIKVGSAYLSKHNEVGLFIKPDWAWNGLESIVLKKIIMKNFRTQYLANTNPKNKKLIMLLRKHKFKLLQQTYELSN